MSRVWRNGSLVPGDALPGSFPPGARCFETIALRAGRVECLDDHLARLRAGLSHLGLACGALAAGELGTWRRAIAGLRPGDAILRLVVGEGFEELGARPILASSETLALRTLRTRRDMPEWLPRPKSAPWANSLAATVELRALGGSAALEGVQLDAHGCVSECTRSSLAWVSDGALHVPDASTGRLPGTALAQLVAASGLPVRSVSVPPPDSADAVLVLRSTLPGGGVAATAWCDVDGREFWRARDLSRSRGLLASLAAWRAQRSVSLA